MDNTNSAVFEWLEVHIGKKQNLKDGKQRSAVVNIGPTSHKIIDTKIKKKFNTH